MIDITESELKFELQANTIIQGKYRKEAYRELLNAKKAKLANNDSDKDFAVKWLKINRSYVNQYTDTINEIKEKLKYFQTLKVA